MHVLNEQLESSGSDEVRLEKWGIGEKMWLKASIVLHHRRQWEWIVQEMI